MQNSVRLLANAGVFIRFEGAAILLDALHCEKTERFSRVREGLLRDMIAGAGDFSRVDLMLVTHGHRDHNCEALAREFLRGHDETMAITPGAPGGKNVRLLRETDESFDVGNVRVKCRKITHEGEEYAHVPNYGYLAEANGRAFMTPGDALSDAEGIAKLVEGVKIDVALLPFPFVTTARGKAVVRDIIRPKKVIAFHLPFPEDDKNRYVKTTKYIVSRDKSAMPPTALLLLEGHAEEM